MLSKAKTIKGELHEAGDVVDVRKDHARRWINDGLANLIVGEVENRITVASENRGHRRFLKTWSYSEDSMTISHGSVDNSSSTTTDADVPVTYTRSSQWEQ